MNTQNNLQGQWEPVVSYDYSFFFKTSVDIYPKFRYKSPNKLLIVLLSTTNLAVSGTPQTMYSMRLVFGGGWFGNRMGGGGGYDES